MPRYFRYILSLILIISALSIGYSKEQKKIELSNADFHSRLTIDTTYTTSGPEKKTEGQFFLNSNLKRTLLPNEQKNHCQVLFHFENPKSEYHSTRTKKNGSIKKKKYIFDKSKFRYYRNGLEKEHNDSYLRLLSIYLTEEQSYYLNKAGRISLQKQEESGKMQISPEQAALEFINQILTLPEKPLTKGMKWQTQIKSSPMLMAFTLFGDLGTVIIDHEIEEVKEGKARVQSKLSWTGDKKGCSSFAGSLFFNQFQIEGAALSTHQLKGPGLIKMDLDVGGKANYKVQKFSSKAVPQNHNLNFQVKLKLSEAPKTK